MSYRAISVNDNIYKRLKALSLIYDTSVSGIACLILDNGLPEVENMTIKEDDSLGIGSENNIKFTKEA